MFAVGFLSAQVKIHKVEAKETVYGLSKQYGVSQDDLIKANPFLKERGLQIGDELTIPQKSDGRIKTVVTTIEEPEREPERELPKEPEQVQEPISEPNYEAIQSADDDYIYLKIEPGQTIYSITKEYGISEAALISLNPQLKHGLKADDIIRIPKKKNVDPEGMYRVQKGDTVYQLSQRFRVTEDQFYISNPIVQIDGLKEGTFVKIPKRNEVVNAVIMDGHIEEVIKQGETIFGLTRRYGVSLDDLLELNPELSEGLMAGMTLKIPLAYGSYLASSGNRASDNEINLAMILPFYVDKSGHSQEKSVSSDILIGAKTALGLLAKRGKNIHLQVFDADSEGGNIERVLSNNDFSKFDAIIGPLFASNFKVMAEKMKDSGIALVSPISSSDDLKGMKNVILANPSEKSIADAVIGEIIENYGGQQIQILTDNRNEKLAEYASSELKRKLGNSDVFITKNIDKLEQKSETLVETLADGSELETTYYTPIITLMVSDSNSLGDAYVEKITSMDPDNALGYGIKFVNAYDIYNTNNKENIDALRNMGFTFGTNRLINVYGVFEREVLIDFVDTYCVNPSEYRQIGFDVVYDLVDRMNPSGGVFHAMGDSHTRLATKFEYKKEGGSYINNGVRIVRLLKKEPLPEMGEDLKD